jgi:hypothetical protein
MAISEHGLAVGVTERDRANGVGVDPQLRREESEGLDVIDCHPLFEVRALHSFHGEIGDAMCAGKLQHAMGRECVARSCCPRLIDQAGARGHLAEFREHGGGHLRRVGARHMVTAHHAHDQQFVK